ELNCVFPDQSIEIQVLRRWSELLKYPRTKPSRPTWLIISETLAKNGPYWRPAAAEDSRGLLHCPDCGAGLRAKASKGGYALTMKDLERSRQWCIADVVVEADETGATKTRPCGAALWQYTDKLPIWAPANYVHQQMRGVFDYLVCDEVHEEKSESSARANA